MALDLLRPARIFRTRTLIAQLLVAALGLTGFAQAAPASASGLDDLTYVGMVYFKKGSTDLTDRASNFIDAKIEDLDLESNFTLVFHTGRTPEGKLVKKLPRLRALAVAEYMDDLGVEGDITLKPRKIAKADWDDKLPLRVKIYVEAGSVSLAPAISIDRTAESILLGSAIAGYGLTNTGGAASFYSISPAAPSGLTFNTSTGMLSGVPLASQAPTPYTITATNPVGSSSVVYTLGVTAVSDKQIISFGFQNTVPPVSGTIDQTTGAIAVTVPAGTDVTNLVATFTFMGASVKVAGKLQTSGVSANNFSIPVSYLVTAQDGTARFYTVTVAVALASAKAITAFGFNYLSAPATGVINESAKTISVVVPAGTNLVGLVPYFTHTGASVRVGAITQISGVSSNNFSAPVTYTVVAQDGSTQNYAVSVVVAPSTDATLDSFSFQGLSPAAVGTINQTSRTVTVSVPFGTNLSTLVATFGFTGASVKVGSTLQVSGVTANNFSGTVNYIVTSTSGVRVVYGVTVVVGSATSKQLTAYRITNLSPGVSGTINEGAKTVSVTVPAGTDVTALVATFSHTGTGIQVGNTVQTSGSSANDFTSPVTYTVIAADGSTQNYTVTVTVTPGVPTYTLTYDGNGNDAGTAPPAVTQEPGLLALASNVGGLDKTGYVFNGWNTQANGLGTHYDTGTSYTLGAANAILFAEWVPLVVTVTFSANGGSGVLDNASLTYTVGSAPLTLPGAGTVTLAGKEFGGWNTQADGLGTHYADGELFAPSANTILYIQWNSQFTLTYDGNGHIAGTVPSPVTQVPGPISLSANIGALEKTGYDFTGWNTQANGLGTSYAPGDVFTLGSANVTLYAIWTPITFTVTFDLQGGSGTLYPVTWTYGTGPFTLSDGTGLTYAGFTFAGWSETPGGTLLGATYEPSNHVTLYAVWTPVP